MPSKNKWRESESKNINITNSINIFLLFSQSCLKDRKFINNAYNNLVSL